MSRSSRRSVPLFSTGLQVGGNPSWLWKARNSTIAGVPCTHLSSRLRMSAAENRRKRLVVLECGSGADLHGQNVTEAATRACRNAIEFNSLPVLADLCEGDLSRMLVRVRLGVPADMLLDVDVEAVKAVFPYGEKEVNVVPGGLLADSGIELKEQGDQPGDTRVVIAVAAVSVFC